MLTASPITRQTVGKTFTIAISVLGVGGLLQLGVISYAFATRSPQVLPAAAVLPKLAGASASPTPKSATVTPALAGPMATPALADAQPKKPTPAPQGQGTVVPANRFEEVVLQGKQLRERGDMTAAITKFREASAMEPRSPIPIAELGTTYEKMGSADKAGEQWRRVYDMGDTAGVHFLLAEAKLKASQQRAIAEARQAPPAPPAPEAGVTTGATLALLPVRKEDDNDNASARRFTLHIPIKASAHAKMDVRDLVIHVLFYDLIDAQNVVQTSANVNSRWMTPPADWLESDTEELAVEYQLPKSDAKSAKREDRKYFGYIVRIYYKQQLQAATAEPERLAQQYPAPPTLSKDPEK